MYIVVFFFTDPSTTEIYTLSLHDALPIYRAPTSGFFSSTSALYIESRSTSTSSVTIGIIAERWRARETLGTVRSEEHTSELQSRRDLVCRLLLEKKKKDKQI